MRNKYTQYRKRLIGIILLLQAAFIFNYDELDFSFLNFSEPKNETSVLETLETYAKQMMNEADDKNSIFDTNECLLSKKETKQILEEKYKVVLTKDPDENIRFILGKCSPIIFIPGIYATRLVIRINCKKLKEKDTIKFMETRLYCGTGVCANEESENEEHVLWPAVLGSPFRLIPSDNNKYSSCLGYFQQFFNNKDECPHNEKGPVCMYSDYVRITFYGGTDSTVKESTCGLRAVRNILSTGNSLVDEALGIGASKIYGEMITKYKRMGYREGFSMGAIPQDYRIFASTNKFVEKAYEYQIEQLYNNTGKKVVIISHSYGTLSTLSNLMKMNKSITSKIKKFIAVAPPFAGADALVNIFLHGFHGFDFEIKIGKTEIFKVNYDLFGQHMMYKAMPIVAELRPQSYINELFSSEKYKEFGKAVLERIDLENECAGKNCDSKYINEHSVLFDKIFGKGTFPSLDEDICKGNLHFFKFLEFQGLEEKEENKEYYTTPCQTNLNKESTCPTLLIKSKDFNPTAEDIPNLCGVYNSSILYNAKCSDPNKTCLDNVYSNGAYPFEKNKKLDFLIDRYNTKFSASIGKKIDMSFFETKEESKAKTEAVINYHNEISLTKELIIPPVDTTVIYSNYILTETGYAWDQSKEETFDSTMNKGGDGTVPNWSSYLVGLKWLYDKKVNNLPQNITLVEYCSLLAENDKYGYDEKNPNKIFFGLGCDCLKNKTYKKGCDHAPMMIDNVLIDYIKTLIYPKNDQEEHFDEKREALLRYKFDSDYSKVCSYKLKEFVDLEKMGN